MPPRSAAARSQAVPAAARLLPPSRVHPVYLTHACAAGVSDMRPIARRQECMHWSQTACWRQDASRGPSTGFHSLLVRKHAPSKQAHQAEFSLGRLCSSRSHAHAPLNCGLTPCVIIAHQILSLPVWPSLACRNCLKVCCVASQWLQWHCKLKEVMRVQECLGRGQEY